MTVCCSTAGTACFYMFIYSPTNIFLDFTPVTFSSTFLDFYLDILFSFLILSWNRPQFAGLDDSKPFLPCSLLDPGMSTAHSSSPSFFSLFFFLTFISVFIHVCPELENFGLKLNLISGSLGLFSFLTILWALRLVSSLFFYCQEHVFGLILMLGL